jgi:hypothetical protein
MSHRRPLVTLAGGLVAAAALVVTGAIAFAQSPAPSVPSTAAGHPHAHQANPQVARMQAQRAELRRSLEAMDARIEKLVETMEGARWRARDRAEEALLAELLAQRRQLREMALAASEGCAGGGHSH